MKLNLLKKFTFAFFSLLFLSCSEDIDLTVQNASEKTDDYFITSEKATDVAVNYFKILNNTNKTLQTKTVKKTTPIKDENDSTVYYIINYKEGGFMIVAADNRSTPILAFSENNDFPIKEETFSPSLKEWLDESVNQIKEIRNQNLSRTYNLEAEWNSVLSKEPPIGDCEDQLYIKGPLLSSNWGQGCGYNNNMPVLSGCSGMPCGKAFAGCVPVAIAQVMKYHQYPTNYNWSSMPLNSGSSHTSQLISDIHSVIPNISYECTGTGVSSSYNIATVFLSTTFHYKYALWGNYNYQTVVSNIQANRPVLLSGSNSSAGHMWVCEGYRRHFICFGDGTGGGVEYLHLYMNWGWSGNHNGWYSFNNFNPNGTNYNNNKKMTYNIKPY